MKAFSPTIYIFLRALARSLHRPFLPALNEPLRYAPVFPVYLRQSILNFSVLVIIDPLFRLRGPSVEPFARRHRFEIWS